MNTSDVTSLIRLRQVSAAPNLDLGLDLLVDALGRFAEPTDEHAVWWNVQAWSDAPSWKHRTRARVLALGDTLDDGSRTDGWRLISRSDVFDRRGDSLDLFLAAMAWGFGNRGYGWRRTSDIINCAGEARVRRTVDELRRATTEHGYEAAWRAWSRNGEAKLQGLDTAFASKVAYFAAFDRSECTGPLIADLNTAWTMWVLTGMWDSRTSANLYRQYVEWAELQARSLHCRPDDIERALFALGPDVRREWQRQQREQVGLKSRRSGEREDRVKDVVATRSALI